MRDIILTILLLASVLAFCLGPFVGIVCAGNIMDNSFETPLLYLHFFFLCIFYPLISTTRREYFDMIGEKPHTGKVDVASSSVFWIMILITIIIIRILAVYESDEIYWLTNQVQIADAFYSWINIFAALIFLRLSRLPEEPEPRKFLIDVCGDEDEDEEGEDFYQYETFRLKRIRPKKRKKPSKKTLAQRKARRRKRK